MIVKLVPAVGVAILLCGPAVASAQAVCGDGMVEMGEACDGGVCCTAGCAFVAAGTVCRPRAGTCGDGDDACLCDAVESCTGSSASCPADGLEASGTVCRPNAKDLLNCPDPDPITNCPDAACDVPEVCTGMDLACPADQFEPDTTLCRTSQGACDLDDFCTGQHRVLPSRPQEQGRVPSVGGVLRPCRELRRLRQRLPRRRHQAGRHPLSPGGGRLRSRGDMHRRTGVPRRRVQDGGHRMSRGRWSLRRRRGLHRLRRRVPGGRLRGRGDRVPSVARCDV